MFILTVSGKEHQGAYAAPNENGDDILYLFETEDDALRFAYQLEDKGYPEIHVIEVDDAVIIKTCEVHDYRYTIITPNDIVIPPETHDYI